MYNAEAMATLERRILRLDIQGTTEHMQHSLKQKVNGRTHCIQQIRGHM